MELLLEITLSLGLVKFVQLALAMCGGSHTLVQVRLTFDMYESSVFEEPGSCSCILHFSLIDPYFCISVLSRARHWSSYWLTTNRLPSTFSQV